jgi:hypothetical protein
MARYESCTGDRNEPSRVRAEQALTRKGRRARRAPAQPSESGPGRSSPGQPGPVAGWVWRARRGSSRKRPTSSVSAAASIPSACRRPRARAIARVSRALRMEEVEAGRVRDAGGGWAMAMKWGECVCS